MQAFPQTDDAEENKARNNQPDAGCQQTAENLYIDNEKTQRHQSGSQVKQLVPPLDQSIGTKAAQSRHGKQKAPDVQNVGIVRKAGVYKGKAEQNGQNAGQKAGLVVFVAEIAEARNRNHQKRYDD